MKSKNLFEQLVKDRYADIDFTPRPCRKPTETKRGSVERIEVYAERLEKGVELWHPDDNWRATEELRLHTKAFRRRE